MTNLIPDILVIMPLNKVKMFFCLPVFCSVSYHMENKMSFDYWHHLKSLGLFQVVPRIKYDPWLNM